MSIFDQYISEGSRAIRLHPDFKQLDYETAASDMIASILHAVYDGEDAHANDEPQDMLDRALRTYEGDQEDREEGR